MSRKCKELVRKCRCNAEKHNEKKDRNGEKTGKEMMEKYLNLSNNKMEKNYVASKGGGGVI